MKTAGIIVLLLTIVAVACGKKDDESSSQFHVPLSRNFGSSQQQASSPIVGAWHTRSAIGFVQIVFYADGSCFSNLFANARYTATTSGISISSELGHFDTKCAIYGNQLHIQFPDGVTIPFDRVPDENLRMLVGKYCGQGDVSSTTCVFDGMGTYVLNGQKGAYWIDEEGIHLIVNREGYGSDMFFGRFQTDNNGISLFSGRDFIYSRCQ